MLNWLMEGEQLSLPARQQRQRVQPNGPAKITIKESGPLVASLLVESTAPGCRHLSREVRLVDVWIDRHQHLIDKESVRAVKEFISDLNSTCLNPLCGSTVRAQWFKLRRTNLRAPVKIGTLVERWVDISNDKYGVTWTTSDAPLVEVGGLTANFPWPGRSQCLPENHQIIFQNYSW